MAIARVRHEVVQAIRDFFYQEGFTLVDTPILTGAIGEEAGNLFATDYFDLGQGVPGADRPAVRRGGRGGAGQGLLLRPHLPRREVEDPPPPDRVLDGRARGGVQRLRRQHAAAGIVRELHRGTGARPTQGGADGARARHRAARAGPGALPAHLLHRCGRAAQRSSAPTSSGATTSAATTRRCWPSSTTGRVFVFNYPKG